MVDKEKETKKEKITQTKDGRTFVDKSAYEKELVTGTFENKDAPGLSNTFSYGYNGIMEKYTLYDGKKATTPRYIARHINTCIIRDTEPIENERGMIIGQKPIMRKRFNFYSEI